MNHKPNDAISVMIVEDDPQNLERFRAVIMADPRFHLVQTAQTARHAIRLLDSVRPDLLLVDLGLPDLHGTEVIRHAARIDPHCDVMVITIFGDERSVFDSIEAGATGYILKDASNSQIINGMLELRGGGAPMSPGIARLVLNRMRGPGTSAAEMPGSPRNGAQLTGREIDVLSLLSRGYSYGEIGDRLGISPHTVTSHIKNSYRKLSVHSGAAAVTAAAELGLLRSPPKIKPAE